MRLIGNSKRYLHLKTVTVRSKHDASLHRCATLFFQIENDGAILDHLLKRNWRNTFGNYRRKCFSSFTGAHQKY